MSATHSWLLYALEFNDFGSLPAEQPIDERDGLLTLITIYRTPGDHHANVQRLRYFLETWLQHTLDQRVRCARTAAADLPELQKIAAETRDEFFSWMTASADPQQVSTFLAVERGTRAPADLPTSALYRFALDGMLETNPALDAELVGSRALFAQDHPLPANPEWDRIVRGARWRDDVDARYLRELRTLLATRELQSA